MSFVNNYRDRRLRRTGMPCSFDFVHVCLNISDKIRLLGTFAKLRPLASSYLFVGLHGRTRLPLDGFS